MFRGTCICACHVFAAQTAKDTLGSSKQHGTSKYHVLPWPWALEVYRDISAMCLHLAPLTVSDESTESVVGPVERNSLMVTSLWVLTELHSSCSRNVPTWHPQELYGTVLLLCRMLISSLWFHVCSGICKTNKLSCMTTSKTIFATHVTVSKPREQVSFQHFEEAWQQNLLAVCAFCQHPGCNNS